MILARHSLETNSGQESIWCRWVNLSAWPEWDRSLESAGLDGPFQPGTRGRLLLQDGVRLDFTLLAVDKGDTGMGFVLGVALTGARLRLDHRLEPSPHGTRITREIRLEGWLAWIHARRLGALLRESVPPGLRALARVAERPL